MVGNLLDDDDTMRADDSPDSFEGRGARRKGQRRTWRTIASAFSQDSPKSARARDGPKSLPVPSIKSSAAIRLRFSNRF